MAADRFEQRRQKLARGLKGHGADALLITDVHNVHYLTGFGGDSSYLIVTPGRSLLVSDGRYDEQLAAECPGLETYIRKTGELLSAAVGTVVDKLGVKAVLFEASAVSVATLDAFKEKAPTVQWGASTGLVENLRIIKDAEEIRRIRVAISVAERAFTGMRADWRWDETEKAVADALEMRMRRLGATEASFPPIIAGGPRAALPHARPTAARLTDEEFVLVDWGAKVDFYCSDLTRVLARPKISRKLAKVHEVVLSAQRAALAAVRPGAIAKDVELTARKALEAGGLEKQFIHSLGHGFGLQVHEGPSLRLSSETPLQSGMVITLEPGVYLPGWGGVRIEDDVLVTKDGHEVLSSLPHGLEELAVCD